MNDEGLIDNADIESALAELQRQYEQAERTWRDDEQTVALVGDRLEQVISAAEVLGEILGSDTAKVRSRLEKEVAPSIMVWRTHLSINPESMAMLVAMLTEKAGHTDAQRLLTSTLEIGICLGRLVGPFARPE